MSHLGCAGEEAAGEKSDGEHSPTPERGCPSRTPEGYSIDGEEA